MRTTEALTQLLGRWHGGDGQAFDELMQRAYRELHAIAEQCFRRERSGHTLQPTALVHEAALRLWNLDELDWRDRTHFYAVAARMMRRILVDHARRRRRQKRGGGVEHVEWREIDSLALDGRSPPGIQALDDALTELEARAPRMARIVELRFFAGLNVTEIAHHLDISTATVARDWRRARAWLYSELRGEAIEE